MRRTLPFLLILAACPNPQLPGMDAGVDAGPIEVTPVELCERIAAARCGLVIRCFTAFAQEDLAACLLLEQQRCTAEFEPLRPAYEDVHIRVSADKLAACETRMKSSACPPTFPPNYPDVAAHPFSDCGLTTGLFAGKVKSGQTCGHAVECEAGSVCIKPGGVCKGTCSSWPQVGENCSFGCALGLICDDKGTPMDAADDVCAAPHGLGELCSRSAECSPELVCSGTCRPRSKAGEACVFDADRLSTCDPGLACDVVPFVMGAVGTCVIPGGEFSPCRFHWACKPGLVCSDLDFTNFPKSAPGQSFCRKPGEPNTNCLPTQYQLYVGDQCGPGTVCDRDARQCKPKPKVGEACTPSTQACVGVGVYCKPTGTGDVGVCAGPAGPGDRCAFDLDATRKVTIPCSEGYCESVNTLSCQAASKALGAICTEDGQCLTGRCAVQEDRTLKCAAACN